MIVQPTFSQAVVYYRHGPQSSMIAWPSALLIPAKFVDLVPVFVNDRIHIIGDPDVVDSTDVTGVFDSTDVTLKRMEHRVPQKNTLKTVKISVEVIRNSTTNVQLHIAQIHRNRVISRQFRIISVNIKDPLEYRSMRS
jgi:hypothetical protein